MCGEKSGVNTCVRNCETDSTLKKKNWHVFLYIASLHFYFLEANQTCLCAAISHLAYLRVKSK